MRRFSGRVGLGLVAALLYAGSAHMQRVRPSLPDDLPQTSDDLARRLIVPIPDRPDDIAIEIGLRDLRIQRLIRRGEFTEVYVPALEAKDLALALGEHVARLPEDRRQPMRLAIRRVVRTSWLLDKYGDLGNRPRVDRTYRLFSSATAEILDAYEIR